ncbi:MAG: ATP-binding protein [Phycisphaerae bacterium]
MKTEPGDRHLAPWLTDPLLGDTGFRLLRYFAVISVAAVMAVLLLVGFGLDAVLRNGVVTEAERDAMRLTRVLRDFEVESLVRTTPDGREELVLGAEQIPALDGRLRSFLAPFDILKIKIYNASAQIIYSTDPTIIGEVDPNNRKLAITMAGSPVSKLESKDLVWDLANEQRPDIDLVETYVPVYGSDDAIIGAVEVYKDVTHDLQGAGRTLIRCVVVLLSALLLVFAGLGLLMRFAASTIRARTLALRGSERRYHALAEVSPVGMFRTDADGICLYVNERWCELSCVSAGQAIGRPWTDGLYMEDRDRIDEAWRRAADERKAFSAEYRFRSAKGGATWVFGQIVGEFEKTGRIVGYVGTVTDITARLRAEETIRRHSEILERTVKERTAELATAKDRAEASSRAKSAFLANMSHELRTPLHGVLSFADFGVEQCGRGKPEDLQEYFRQIQSSGQSLLALLNDVLDLAKLEAGKMTYDMQEANLGELIRTVGSEFEALAAERRLTIQYPGSEPNAWTRIDASRVGQVIRNLLSNAVKFSPDGGVIDVDLQCHNRSVEVAIRDEGPGIPEDELETVFDKFVQSSKTRNGAGGTGLGLAICRQIMKAQNGSIWAENSPQGGALF